MKLKLPIAFSILFWWTNVLLAQIPGHLAQYNFTGNANDSKGSNHGTVYSATLTTDRFGNSNSAYSFSSSASSYISIPYSNFFNPNYSFSIWVKPAAFASYGNSTILVSIGGNGGDQNMQIENNRNYGSPMGVITGFSLTAYQKSGSTVQVGGTCVGTMPNTNQWYHVVVTRDSNYYKVYVDGCLKSTSSNYNGYLPFYGNNSFDARIGCRERGSLYFDGVIDDVGIYNRAITAAEVTKLYNNLKPLTITKDTTICKDDFQQFKLKAPRTYCSYKWVNMASPSSTLGTDSQLMINISSTSTFRCVTNSRDTALVKITIIPRPKLNIGNDTFYCGNVVRTLDAGSKAKSYLWNNSSTSRYRAVTDSGKFHVLFTDSFGCKARDSIWLRIHPLPKFSLGKDTHYCNTFSRQLTTLASMKKYIWNTQDSIQTISIDKKGLYWAEAIDTNNCVFRDSISIKNPQLIAGFTTIVLDSCANTNRYFFDDTSYLKENTKTKSKFYFGDNSSTFIDSVLKKYTSAGSYSVKHVVETDYGCKDSISKSYEVHRNNSIGFTINKFNQCFNGHDFVFTNSSNVQNGSLNYLWNFGDNTTDTSRNIASKKYSKDTFFNVTLYTQTDKYCKDTLTKQIVVYPNARLSYSINKLTQCFNGHSVDIINNSSIRTGSISKTDWSFSDNSIATSNSIINKKFNNADTYSVKLISTSDKGCLDTLEKSFVIHPNTNPDFSINNDIQCYKWHSLNFTNTSTLSNGNYTSLWNFGDGSFSTLKDIVNKKYNLYGGYLITLITTTNNACNDTITKSITIHPSPVDSFVISNSRQCFRSNTFNLLNASTIPSGSIVNRVWNLDDGNTANTFNVINHKYSGEDSFYVQLSSTSDKACKDTFTKLAVTFPQPIAKYTIPNDSQCWQKNYFNIINQSTIKYGSWTNKWDFGDNTSDTNYSPSTKKYANKSATYLVKYVVTSSHGCSDSLNHRIHLLERPIADFLINDSIQCFKNHLFKFTNMTTFSALNTVSYFWDYGNGNKSTGINPNDATYTSANYHNVQLVAYSYLTNCYDTSTVRILPAPHSVPQFYVNKDSQCLKTNQFVFNNQSSISFGKLNYLWTYGDGSKDTVRNPVKSYISGFMRNVQLKVTTNNNCSDSITKPIVIIPHPKANLMSNDTAQCLNKHSFDFTNTSTSAYGSMSFKWMSDDGFTSNTKDLQGKTFITFGYHTLKLAAYTYQGCPDTISKIVFLEKDKNTVINQINLDSQCLKGNDFSFTGNSNNSNVNFSSYRWDFGDSKQSSSSNPKHTYSLDGLKIVLLETVSLNGCIDSGFYNVRVYPQALLDFSATSPCFPDSVKILNNSTIVNGKISAYKFEFSDGNISTLVHPSNKFSSPGTYNVILASVTDKGCKDTLNKTGLIVVRPKPVAQFSQQRLADKQFDVSTIKFTNKSSIDAIKFNWNFGNGNISSDENPEADFQDTFRRLITLEVTNAAGCTDTFKNMTGSLVTDFVFYMPDAFSPGTDGTNDVLKPVMTPYVRKYEMEVFNRWGEKVFSTNNLNEGWNGAYQGTDCEQGVYICRIYLVPMRGAIRSLNQTITLMR